MPTMTITSWGDAVFLSLSNALNSFLTAIPLVIGAVTATLESFPDGNGTLRALGFLGLFDTLFALLAWGTFEHLTGE